MCLDGYDLLYIKTEDYEEAWRNARGSNYDP